MSSIIGWFSDSVNATRWRLKRRVHVSWLVATMSLGIVVGIIMAQSWGEWFGSISWLLVGVILAGFAFWRRYVYMLVMIFIAGAATGLWRGSIDQQQLTPYKNLYGHHLTVVGMVGDDADRGEKGELILRLGEMHINNHPMPGTVWVTIRSHHEIKRSDVVTVEGKLTEGFGSFTASIYSAELRKVQQGSDIAREIRDEFANEVRQAIPDPEASLGIGYLVGQRRALPPELDEALKIAGLTHIVVASGYNLTILVRLARRLFNKISRYTALMAAGGLVICFVAITGASPSMSRAGLITGLSLLAWYYGRTFHPFVLLPFAAAVTLLLNPSYGWNDLGWQLSFAAFAGVMVVAPLMQAYFFGDKKPGTLRQILGETVAASLCTLPILVLAFGEFSNIAIVANLLVLPLVPLAMLLTFISGVGAMIMPGIAETIGLPASALLQYMTGIAQYLATLPWAQTTLQINALVACLVYLVLGVAAFYMWRRTRYNLGDTNIVE